MSRTDLPDHDRQPSAPPERRPAATRQRAALAAFAMVCVVSALVTLGQAGIPQTASGCLGNTVAGVRAELLFGRYAGPSLTVTSDRFQDFLDREVTPRFPDGFTVYDASGQWHDTAAAGIIREPSYALMIVLREASRAHDRLGAIAEAYKRQFNQQSVLVSVSPTCFAL